MDGLLRDKSWAPGKPPLPVATVARVLALTCPEPPGENTHWTGRAMAKAVVISLRSVQRIWATHRLQPPRIRKFMRALTLPTVVESWSLTTLRKELAKIGAKVVSHGRYVRFQLAVVAVPRNLFREILRLIDELRPRPPVRC